MPTAPKPITSVSSRYGEPQVLVDSELDLKFPEEPGASWFDVPVDGVLTFPKDPIGETSTTDPALNSIAGEFATYVDAIVCDELPSSAGTVDIRTADDVDSIFSLKVPTSANLPFVFKFPQPLLLAIPWGVKVDQASLRPKIFFRRISGR